MSKIIPLLPDAIFEFLTGSEFVDACHQEFKQLDSDGNGVLDGQGLTALDARVWGNWCWHWKHLS